MHISLRFPLSHDFFFFFSVTSFTGVHSFHTDSVGPGLIFFFFPFRLQLFWPQTMTQRCTAVELLIIINIIIIICSRITVGKDMFSTYCRCQSFLPRLETVPQNKDHSRLKLQSHFWQMRLRDQTCLLIQTRTCPPAAQMSSLGSYRIKFLSLAICSPCSNFFLPAHFSHFYKTVTLPLLLYFTSTCFLAPSW